MNSLSPNNDYFLKNNMIEEHTSKNYFCNSIDMNYMFLPKTNLNIKNNNKNRKKKQIF